MAPAKPEAPIKPTPVAKKEETSPFANIFGASKPAAKPQPVKTPEPQALAPPKVPPAKEIDISPNAMSEALNDFFGTKSKPAPKPKPQPVAETKPVAPEKAAPQPFSFFGSAPAVATKPAAPKKTPPPAPAPARKSPTLSLFNANKPAVVKKSEPTPVVQEKKPAPTGGAFNFFGGAPAKKPASPPPAPVVVEKPKPQKGSGTFSLFGGAPGGTRAVSKGTQVVSKKAATPAATKAVTPKKQSGGSGTFSLFGGGSPAKKATPVAQPNKQSQVNKAAELAAERKAKAAEAAAEKERKMAEIAAERKAKAEAIAAANAAKREAQVRKSYFCLVLNKMYVCEISHTCEIKPTLCLYRIKLFCIHVLLTYLPLSL